MFFLSHKVLLGPSYLGGGPPVSLGKTPAHHTSAGSGQQTFRIIEKHKYNIIFDVKVSPPV